MKQIFRWHVAVQHVKCYLTDPIASHTIIVRWFGSGLLVIFVALGGRAVDILVIVVAQGLSGGGLRRLGFTISESCSVL